MKPFLTCKDCGEKGFCDTKTIGKYNYFVCSNCSSNYLYREEKGSVEGDKDDIQ